MKRNNHWKVIVGLIAALVILVGIGACTSSVYIKESVHHGCLVTDKDRTSGGSGGGSDMRVYTDHCGNFKVADNWFKGVTDSSDTYRKLQKGHTYTLTTTGFRFGLTSSFPNIISAQEER